MKNLLYWILFVLIFSLAGSNFSFSQNPSRPNILLVIIDDGRYADYNETGGPSWFVTPAISRIATEGANFSNSFVVLSLCEPSRVSILTGKYPHHNGFMYNTQSYDTSTLTIARILRENGYYTGLVGKFMNSFETFPSSDFNYWCAYDGQGNYNPKVFDLNGTDTLLNENVSVAINDNAIHFLESVPPDSPFFLMFTPKAPHVAYTAYPGYENVYHNEAVSFPTNFYGYVKNYPGYLYLDNLYDNDSAGCVNDIQTYYETLIGVEVGLDSIFSVLESKGILDSTLIIFTSDNGVFIGDHHLRKKRFAYEESIHVPLFIRYPQWFTAGTVVNDEMSLNIDLFRTLLDAAAIPDTFNDDGISLRELAMSTAHRKEFLFEYFRDTIMDSIPDFRSVRTFYHKYIRSSCEQTTEEFYDLVNDPKEDSNQIFNPVYQTLIEAYRHKLDSFRAVLGDDPANDTLIECSLQNIDTIYLTTPNTIIESSFTLAPNPVHDVLILGFSGATSNSLKITISDLSGRILKKQVIHSPGSKEITSLQFPMEQFAAGLFVLKVEYGNNSWVKLVVKE